MVKGICYRDLGVSWVYIGMSLLGWIDEKQGYHYEMCSYSNTIKYTHFDPQHGSLVT
jgi:hypothetical protein